MKTLKISRKTGETEKQIGFMKYNPSIDKNKQIKDFCYSYGIDPNREKILVEEMKQFKCVYTMKNGGVYTQDNITAPDEAQAKIKMMIWLNQFNHLDTVYDTEIKVTEIIQPTQPEQLTQALEDSIAEQIEKKYQIDDYAIKDSMHDGKLAEWLDEDDGDIMISSLLITDDKTAFEFSVWYEMATSIRKKIIERNEERENNRGEVDDDREQELYYRRYQEDSLSYNVAKR